MRERCGKWMPLAKTYCFCFARHLGPCRSQESVKQRLVYERERWANEPEYRERKNARQRPGNPYYEKHMLSARQYSRRKAIGRDRQLIEELERVVTDGTQE